MHWLPTYRYEICTVGAQDVEQLRDAIEKDVIG